MWSPFVLSKQTESQLADFTQLFFGQALRHKITVPLRIQMGDRTTAEPYSTARAAGPFKSTGTGNFNNDCRSILPVPVFGSSATY
ncbi:hypothetical protein EHI47_37160 [Rhizobium leguminosarum]|uniref:Uncharacterized protein n=1 Tax=Rhizobium leguminosarum TaxID=384 RepID=A0A444HIA7_RHILE|nr:hypothetical protein EHI47_37160 [Rhizobium leguminosarum]